MELIQELFVTFLKSEYSKKEIQKFFECVLEKECYKTLRKIKEIIQNDELDDSDCFAKIENIICLFENMGIDCAGRHDF